MTPAKMTIIVNIQAMAKTCQAPDAFEDLEKMSLKQLREIQIRRVKW